MILKLSIAMKGVLKREDSQKGVLKWEASRFDDIGWVETGYYCNRPLKGGSKRELYLVYLN